MAVGALTVGCGPLFALGCVGKGGLVGAVDEATGVSCPRFCDAANKACGALDVVFVDIVGTLDRRRISSVITMDHMVTMIEAYPRANNMFVNYSETQQERVYSSYLELDLSEVEPCISGPKRWDSRFVSLHTTLCPRVGLMEESEKVLLRNRHVNWAYRSNHGLKQVLHQALELQNICLKVIYIIASTVLSGNRNFEGRVHALTGANYLASPPLVVAYDLVDMI
ncbi:aconitate hydratase, cytoplasmic [Artemisia annua]|uniref:Aconitate hydratase, cytoplasmic n=1 Tax=Artemisia annua TaxID=35608 RepID=A0A2U1L872_ARTAN|nr:aconitate hydratase, cytoplasmic [Artemisia annua]